MSHRLDLSHGRQPLHSFQQVILGSGLLALSAIIHVIAVTLCVAFLKRLSAHLPTAQRPMSRVMAFLVLTVCFVVIAHTAQIWIWAATFFAIGDLPNLSTSFYFSTVTYTTLGYGDIVLGPDARIVATFCAVTGLLTFGISTALLIGVLSRVLPDVFRDE